MHKELAMAARLNALGIAFLVAICAAALASGCGGGDGDDATATAATKAEYLKQANAACRRERAGLKQRIAEFRRLREGDEPREVFNGELARNVLLPTIENEMEAIRALRAPPGEDGRIDHLLSLEELALTNVVYMERVSSIAAVKREFADSARRLSAYGLPDCANGPG